MKGRVARIRDSELAELYSLGVPIELLARLTGRSEKGAVAKAFRAGGRRLTNGPLPAQRHQALRIKRAARIAAQIAMYPPRSMFEGAA